MPYLQLFGFTVASVATERGGLQLWEQRRLGEQAEGVAVVGGGAETRNGFAMGFRGITFVHVPAVLRKFLVDAFHKLITVGLCKNRRGGDAHHLAVAFHNALVADAVVGTETVAVDKQKVGTHRQAVHGAVHGEKRSLKNVDMVNLIVVNDAHCPSQGVALYYGTQCVAGMLGKLL